MYENIIPFSTLHLFLHYGGTPQGRQSDWPELCHAARQVCHLCHACPWSSVFSGGKFPAPKEAVTANSSTILSLLLHARSLGCDFSGPTQTGVDFWFRMGFCWCTDRKCADEQIPSHARHHRRNRSTNSYEIFHSKTGIGISKRQNTSLHSASYFPAPLLSGDGFFLLICRMR